jgi:ABC-type sugar transport system substrate-binding protein
VSKTTPALALAVILVAGLSACSDGTASSTAKPASDGSSTGTTKSIQFVNPLPNYPQWRLIGDCMKKEAVKRGLKYTESGPTGTLNANVMIQQVQQAIANHKTAVVTFPASDGFAPLLKQAQQKHIITATMYGSGDAASGADINIGPDWTHLGELYAQDIAQRSGRQNVGLMAVATSGIGKLWIDGVKAAAAKTANVKVVGVVVTGDDPAKALPQANALLAAHPEINVIATHMGTPTPGIVAAIKAKGLLGKVVLVGNGPNNGGDKALDSGAAYGMLVQGLCQAGEDTADAVGNKLDGKAKGEMTNLPVDAKFVTKADYKETLAGGRYL